LLEDEHCAVGIGYPWRARTQDAALTFRLTKKDLETALEAIALRDGDIARALEEVGYPDERRQGEPSFENFLKVIVGQQLSVNAAATIFGRIRTALDGRFEPQSVAGMTDEELRALGLSRPKIRYVRGLCDALIDGRFEPSTLTTLPDDQVVEEITRLTGFGRWSAEMVLLFSLGRPDVWPADDLAIRAGLQRLKQLPARPDRQQADRIAEAWRPYRGAVAILIWHYYSNAPLK
jgi:DNA-3-methyladenine glycosylase II